MIAPVDFADELKLYLYLTEPVVENFGFDKDSMPQGSELDLPKDWWSVWRCEVLITDPDGEYNVVLFTNEHTLLSFICPGHADDFEGMIEYFEQSFLNHLKKHGAKLPKQVSTVLVTMLGEPEEFCDDSWWLVDCATKDLVERKLTIEEAQMRVNHGPISEVGGESAMYFFKEAFLKNPPWGSSTED